jgi:hypothetical protein
MKQRKTIWLLGISCVLVNAVSVYFYINRRETGDYIHHVSYEKLYAPAHNEEKHHRKKWNKTTDQFHEHELEAGKHLTATYAGVNDHDSTLIKVIKIGAWLRRSFNQCAIGKPTPAFEKLSIPDQYKSAVNGQSPIWCGTYGSQFSFFCSANGITSRYIESKGGRDNHVVNETYIPELGQWVFSDLLNNVILSKDHTGRLQNTVDLLHRNVNGDSSVLRAYGHTSDSTLQIVARDEKSQLWNDYFNMHNHLFFYYTTDLDHVYHPVQKTKRYIYPKSWYELFTLQPITNSSFYLRIFFLYAGITLFGLFLYFILKKHD